MSDGAFRKLLEVTRNPDLMADTTPAESETQSAAQRMDSLVNVDTLQRFKEAANEMLVDLRNDGFEDEEVTEWLESVITDEYNQSQTPETSDPGEMTDAEIEAHGGPSGLPSGEEPDELGRHYGRNERRGEKQ